jgi:general secretion pathway protein H
MISRSSARHRRVVPGHRREAGFTLIEVIVTLAILGFALVLIVGYRAPWSAALGLRGTAAELASQLRFARSEAVLRNRPVSFEIDLAAHRYRVGNQPARQLPLRYEIVLLTITGERRDTTRGDIRFNADGTSTGGRVALSDGTRNMAVGVDWLTGRVTVADAQ